MAQRRIQIARVLGTVAGLGDEQRVVGACVALQHRGVQRVLGHVDVRRQQVDVRCRRLPHVEHVVGGAAAGVLPGLAGIERAAQRRIDVDRQGIRGLAGLGDTVDEVRDVPRVEDLVGLGAEHLRPAARRLAEPLQQRLRHRAVEHALRHRREVARTAVGARLVLRLHHDHRALRIGLAQMPHESNEGGAVGLQRGRRQRRQRTQAPPVARDHARKARIVGLDPVRRVVGAVVLPGAEPQQHQPHPLRARLRQKSVDEGEIEAALFRFHLLPGDRHLHRVRPQRADRRPDLRQRRRIVAGVVDLRAKDQERRAVDQQGMPTVGAHQARDRCLGRRRCRGSGRVRLRRRCIRRGLAAAQQQRQQERQPPCGAQRARRRSDSPHVAGAQPHQSSLRNGPTGNCSRLTRLASSGFSLQA
ncbi:hypothetical protein NB689_002904 [Xanthomonas sacchari]|nr:hypothetical protein [Xanthomonas sacchari]